MKKDQLKTLRTKSEKDLEKFAKEKRAELGKLVVKTKSESEKNLKKAKNLKIEIAQILTVLREMQIVREEGEDKK